MREAIKLLGVDTVRQAVMAAAMQAVMAADTEHPLVVTAVVMAVDTVPLPVGTADTMHPQADTGPPLVVTAVVMAVDTVLLQEDTEPPLVVTENNC
jgi:hypothetical protein